MYHKTKDSEKLSGVFELSNLIELILTPTHIDVVRSI
jgi:hypothetical protein